MSQFLDRLRSLIDLEYEEEGRRLAEERERYSAFQRQVLGLSLVRMLADEGRPTSFGRRFIHAFRPSNGESLPETRITSGMEVQVSSHPRRPLGSVFLVASDRIVVSFGENHRFEGLQILDLAQDRITYHRMCRALERVGEARGNRLAELRDLFLGETRPSSIEPKPMDLLDTGLNASQREAVERAVAAPDFFLIHGPPGTGKTRTVTEVVRQLRRRGERVLVCAPSNIAVDNVVERLWTENESVVRVGNPSRVLPHLLETTLDAAVERATNRKLMQTLTSEKQKLQRDLARGGRTREIRARVAQVNREIRAEETNTLRRVLAAAPIVLATLAGSGVREIAGEEFDVLVIDEAAQALEPACYIPLHACQRVVFAGDHLQLPPTVLSREAEREGLQRTLFERLEARFAETHSALLNVQYRMHRELMGFVSESMYQGRLSADPAVADWTLGSLRPLCYVDTAGCGFEEETVEGTETFLNRGELRLVKRFLSELLECGVSPADIGIITPYDGQVQFFRREMKTTGLEIDSVDGFQGREKEAIIFSAVRSNPNGQIGFLSDIRRMNVALSRAKKRLVIVGDSATLCHHEFYDAFVSYTERCDAYRSAWEYLDQ